MGMPPRSGVTWTLTCSIAYEWELTNSHSIAVSFSESVRMPGSATDPPIN